VIVGPAGSVAITWPKTAASAAANASLEPATDVAESAGPSYPIGA